MRIIRYPHPTLRHASKPLKRVDAGLKKMIREMFDLMYELPDRKPGQKYVLTAEMIRGDVSILPQDDSAAA